MIYVLLKNKVGIMNNNNNTTTTSSSWFTPKRMKEIAIVIITLDLILLVIWFGGSIYIIVNLDIACFENQFITNFLILLHFALGMCITNIESEIEKEEIKHKIDNGGDGKPLLYLPYQFYSPTTWIFTSIISFGGDVILLSA